MTRAAAIVASLFGFVTLGVFIAFSFLPESQAAYGMSRAMADDLSLFQRAESVGDLLRVFGGSETSAARAAAFHAVNTLDLWAFIPAYAIFLIAAALFIAGGLTSPLAYAAIGFALIGAGADVVETVLQLRMTADLTNAAAHLPVAPWHWLKYGALALNGFALAGLCLLRRPQRWILGVAALLPLPAMLAALSDLTEPRVLTAALTVYWVALLGVAVMGVWRKA